MMEMSKLPSKVLQTSESILFLYPLLYHSPAHELSYFLLLTGIMCQSWRPVKEHIWYRIHQTLIGTANQMNLIFYKDIFFFSFSH